MQQELIQSTGSIELGIEDLETLEAPSYASGFAGILVGVGIGLIVVGLT